MRKTYNEFKELPYSNKQTRTWAETFLHWHQETKNDYTQRYESYRRSLNTGESNRKSESYFSTNKERRSSIPLEETDLYKALKKFRLKESRIRNIPAYFIFNDEQLNNLIRAQPKTKEELQMVKGFRTVKVEQYGDDILKMIDEHTNE